MDYADDYYTLSTGRRFYANNGILGLGPPEEDEALRGCFYGYDGSVSQPEDTDPTGPEPEPLTPPERREITVMMIERWRAWAGIGA
jgi:hypothetical protein